MAFGKNNYGNRRNRKNDDDPNEEKSRKERREERMHQLHDFPEEEAQEVTLVELLRRPINSYRIYFGSSHITVHESTMIRYGMTKGSFFDKKAVQDIIVDNERQVAYAQAIYYLSFKARTSGEVEQKLLEKELDPQAIEETIKRLIDEKLIDDAFYAQEWTKQRVTNKKKGKVVVKQELKRKGINPELIDEALEAIDDEDELRSAEELAAKKWRTTKGELWERKRKTAAFVMRRGFSSELVRRALDNVLSREGEDAEELGTEFD
ncbi:regulatory protein RecX [Saccharibacillus sp. JS10]|uniref:regulatory protein RecX n=1 Tax=Saccharibacillus sp. JS10 TaxID=2950552 RepID=UPI00210C11BB|nr:RecX family transcriptional regulator [Saccharibacillus sp. JS10]MCQ4087256.1 RecX family transcriptional regulator [Saccharibacillus sp. JS10]